MLALQVLLAAASLLLVVAGVTKVRSPVQAHRAARQSGLPSTPAAIRGLGVVEVVAGAGALASDAPLVRFAVAALYALFLGFVLLALWRATPLSSCGCFGTDDAAPSLAHVATNAAAAATATVLALEGGAAPLRVIADGGGGAFTVALGGPLAALAAGVVLLGRLPGAASLRRAR